MKPLIARVGGKFKLASKIVRMFPKHDVYIEPFLGGGSIFFRKEPSKKEYINDIDKDIYHIFKDVKKFGEKIPSMKFTASRKKFLELKTKKYTDPLKRLHRNLYLSRYSFAGNRINYAHSKAPILIKRNAMKYKERLKKAVITNVDWKKLLKHDSKTSFMYLDPPYETGSTKLWNYKKFSAKSLLPVLKKIKGKFLLSFEYSKENMKLFKDFHITKVTTNYSVAPGESQRKTEILIKNY